MDRPSHRVFMTFFYRAGWQVQFYGSRSGSLRCPGCLPLPILRKFASWPGEVKAWGDSESRQMLEHAIEIGRGGCYLRLTPEAVSEAEAVRMNLPISPFQGNYRSQSLDFWSTLDRPGLCNYLPRAGRLRFGAKAKF